MPSLTFNFVNCIVILGTMNVKTENIPESPFHSYCEANKVKQPATI